MAKKQPTLAEFLNEHESEKTSDYTHCSFEPAKRYYIQEDEQDEFYELYSKVTKHLSIVEKHRDESCVLIDFDFRQTDDIRKYTKKMVSEIILIQMNFLKEYMGIPSPTRIFVLEKPIRACKDYFKDGLHIVIPDIITTPEYQYAMRDETMDKIQEILNCCEYTNPIKDIYDKSVIFKNNWFLLGSKKPDEPTPWSVSYILEWTDDSPSLKETPNIYEKLELIELLSIRNKFRDPDVNPILKQIDKPVVEAPKPKTESIRSAIRPDLEIVIKLVQILNPTRADNYEEWMHVGWCLHNISSELLDTWDTFSTQSSKYTQGECEKLWDNMKTEGLSIGTLHYWAKEDNLTEYKQIIQNSIFNNIKICNGSHEYVATIVYSILKYKYVCASSDGKLWYIFNGVLWKPDPSELNLRREISTTVREQYMQTMNKLAYSQSTDDMESTTSTSTTVDQIKKYCEKLLKTAFKLQDSSFKDKVVKEMRVHFYKENFLTDLDANPNLIGFQNGVWCLKEKEFRSSSPEDYISYSVGYDYHLEINPEYRQNVIRYFERLHPDKEQREYVLKTLARQFYGDHGGELFHIHAGFQASAGNGKSVFFEVLELCFRDYIHKFQVEILVVKQRGDPHKPIPEFKNWRGKRILYCTEPNSDDKLNSGVLKELTGGESISYRMLFSNEIVKFRPMYKLSIMCNDAPIVEGNDEGIKRRIRKIDYLSKFVNRDEVDESNHCYEKDLNFVDQFKQENALKMEFARYILEHYDHAYKYEMPDIIKKSSTMYIDENNNVLNFVKEFIVKDTDGFFTLKEAKEHFKNSQHFNGKLTTLKNDLQKILKIQCIEEKKIKGRKYRSAFMGYSFIQAEIEENEDDIEA